MLIRNFLFHRVSDEKDLLWPPMTPHLFRQTIQRLQKKFEIVPLEHFLDDPGAFTSSRKLATVLFDDGYKDNIEYAAPILKEANCPASFYVVTDSINRDIPTWTYIIDHVFQQTKKEQVELALDFVPTTFRALHFNDPAQADRIRQVKPWMKSLSNAERLQVMQLILAACNDVPSPAGKMMNWDHVRQLDQAGFIIGSHSHTHPMLASLKNEKEIEEELVQSGNILIKELGKPPATISYPIGSFDDRVKRISKSAGYKYGLAVEQQFFSYPTTDLFQIPRVELYQEPGWKQGLRISGWYSRLKKWKP